MKKNPLMRLGKAFAFGVIGVIVGAALLLSAARVMTPMLNHQRDFFQRWASQAFHQPVAIGRVTVGWRGFNPEMSFSDVTVLDPKREHPLLHVDQLSISINLFYSLLKRELLPGHLTITGTELNVRQAQNGNFSVAKIGRVKNIVLWMLTQSDVSVDKMHVNFRRRNGQLLRVGGIRLVVNNTVTKHTISGVAGLLQAVPTQLRFVFNLQDIDLSSGQWGGRLYLAAKAIDLKQWVGDASLQRYFRHITLAQGRADVQAWATWKKGQCVSVQSVLKGRQVKLLAHETVLLNHFFANVLWARESQGWKVSADHLMLDMNGHTWPEHSFGMRVVHKQDDATQVLLGTRFVRLQDIQTLAEQVVTWDSGFQTIYQHLKPVGDLHDVVLQYTRVPNQPLNYEVSAQFEKLGVSPWQKIPGLTGLTGTLRVTSQQGQLNVEGQDSTIQSPYLLKRTLALDHLKLKALWQKEGHDWQVSVPAFSINDDHLSTVGKFMATVPASGLPALTVSARFDLPQVQYLKEYLPKADVAPHLMSWFNQAFRGGSLTNGHIEFRGALRDFPFNKGQGDFKFFADAKAVTLHYAPHWPDIKQLNATVHVHNQALTIESKQADVLGNALDRVKVVIPDLRQPILTAEGHSTSDLEQGFRFLKASPLQIAKRVDGLAAHGPMNLNLKLTVPLKPGLGQIETEGDIKVKQGSLRHPPWKAALTDMSGRFHFTNQSLTAHAVTATLYQTPMNIAITTVRHGGKPEFVQFDATGRLNLAALKHEQGVTLSSVQGVMPYHAVLMLGSEGSSVNTALIVHSNLKGARLDLPGSFSKKAGEERAFRLEARFDQHPIAVTYGDLSLSLLSKPLGWSIGIQSPIAQGHVLIPQDKKTAWQAHFERLYWPKSHASSTKAYDPRHIPSIHFSCDDFHYGDRDFGKVDLQAVSKPYGLSIKQLLMKSKLMTLSSEGAWWHVGHEQWTLFDGYFTSKDMGKVLRDGHTTQALVGGHGKATFKLRWNGAPNEFEINNLKGDIGVHFEDGRIVQLSQDAESDLGIGRLLNLLSLQSLPEHLTLNFENQKEGFPFKVLEGDFKVDGGNVRTMDTSLVGDIAWVRVNGLIAFLNQRYDLHLNVIPNVTSTLPLVATLLGGPVAGAVTWAANKVLARQIGKAAQFDYHVTGTWKKPSVVELPKPAATTA